MSAQDNLNQAQFGRHERPVSAWDSAPEDDTDLDYYPRGTWEFGGKHAKPEPGVNR